MIFLTRRGSLQPFTTDLPEAEALHALRSVIDTGEPGAPRLNTQSAAAVAPVLEAFTAVEEQLLVVPYITIFEYLQVNRWQGAGTTPPWGVVLCLTLSRPSSMPMHVH